jgi:hypothetical protein
MSDTRRWGAVRRWWSARNVALGGSVRGRGAERRRARNTAGAVLRVNLSADSARGQPEAGPQERLSRTGDNLANVIQHLAERHGDRLEQIFGVLRQRVPRIERVLADTMPDGRLLLQIKDAPFSHPVLARFASDEIAVTRNYGDSLLNALNTAVQEHDTLRSEGGWPALTLSW